VFLKVVDEVESKSSGAQYTNENMNISVGGSYKVFRKI